VPTQLLCHWYSRIPPSNTPDTNNHNPFQRSDFWISKYKSRYIKPWPNVPVALLKIPRTAPPKRFKSWELGTSRSLPILLTIYGVCSYTKHKNIHVHSSHMTHKHARKNSQWLPGTSDTDSGAITAPSAAHLGAKSRWLIASVHTKNQVSQLTHQHINLKPQVL